MAGERCQNLAGQTQRPIVRLLNAFESRQVDVQRLMLSFGVHNFRVKRWHFGDSVAFGLSPDHPEAYLFRDLALEIEVAGIAVVCWLCDELDLEESPCCVCPGYGEDWSVGQQAKLALMFGQPVVEGSICDWVRVPEDEITLWLNGYPLRA